MIDYTDGPYTWAWTQKKVGPIKESPLSRKGRKTEERSGQKICRGEEGMGRDVG